MTTLKKGDEAPTFRAKDQDGSTICLEDLLEKRLILYFYPKDDTPGCTREACTLRDGYEQLKNLGFGVVGVSPDPSASHRKFIAKYKLPFPLIADTDRSMAAAYGVYGEKKMYGKSVQGIHRTTFIIERNGRISEIITKVDTANPVAQILEFMK